MSRTGPGSPRRPHDSARLLQHRTRTPSHASIILSRSTRIAQHREQVRMCSRCRPVDMCSRCIRTSKTLPVLASTRSRGVQRSRTYSMTSRTSRRAALPAPPSLHSRANPRLQKASLTLARASCILLRTSLPLHRSARYAYRRARSPEASLILGFAQTRPVHPASSFGLFLHPSELAPEPDLHNRSTVRVSPPTRLTASSSDTRPSELWYEVPS
ncbi:hypothetical protein OH76DRAFT_718970 [Lentinus brumalis]|uniref:Uncharacterized protein n=1 Tax=Lentinus brumalis TaxID=2498619 RepID=A0A371D5M6_9APHY|nr:hypothetical protein OH76DRAFT_718970 [Polyporus brumalis]